MVIIHYCSKRGTADTAHICNVQTCKPNPRLIINRVKSPLHRACLPPPRPTLVRQQIEAYERIGAVFGKGYQVAEDTQDKTVSLTLSKHKLFGLVCVNTDESLSTEDTETILSIILCKFNSE